MNDLLALMHDTAHDLNNIGLILATFPDINQLTEEQKQWLGVINDCKNNLVSKLDSYYTKTKGQ